VGVLRCPVDIEFPEYVEENLDQRGDRGWNRYNPHRLVHYKHLGFGRARGRTRRKSGMVPNQTQVTVLNVETRYEK
jgi:hypothetical protein